MLEEEENVKLISDSLQSVSDNSNKPCCEWWTVKSDIGLIKGIFKHGYGNYEAVRYDAALAEYFAVSKDTREENDGENTESDDTTMTETARDSNAGSAHQTQWPIADTLTRRLKRYDQCQ